MRNRNAFTIVELVVVLIIVSICIGLLVPAVSALRHSLRVRRAAIEQTAELASHAATNPVISVTNFGQEHMATIKHDGCWFVIIRRYEVEAMIHHPRCPLCYGEDK